MNKNQEEVKRIAGIIEKHFPSIIPRVDNFYTNIAKEILAGYMKLDDVELDEEKIKPLTFNFKCGCFLTVYVDPNNRLNAGLACCNEHEHPYAKTEDYYLSNKEEKCI